MRKDRPVMVKIQARCMAEATGLPVDFRDCAQ